MRIRFRLEQLLRKYAPDKVAGSRGGLFTEMENWSDARGGSEYLERHKMSRLFHNEAGSLSFALLGELCNFLVEQCRVPQHLLPQELFGAEEHMLDLVASTERVRFFLSERTSAKWGNNPYVMAVDAELQSSLTSLIAHHFAVRGKVLQDTDTILVDAPPRNVVGNAGTKAWSQIKQAASKRYRDAAKSNGVSLVATGSTKVNCIVEEIIAAHFGEVAYRSCVPKQVADRKVPLFVRYRDRDPKPASCFGGLELAKDFGKTQPGIYYATAQGQWVCAPCDDDGHDAAAVAYFHDVERNQIQFVCSGFSSRATRCLTHKLDKLIDQLWPPQISHTKLVAGLFLVEFHFRPAKGRNEDELAALRGFRVIRLDDAVVQQRFPLDVSRHPR